MNGLDLIGWLGFVGLGLFYWLIGSGHVLRAYVFGTLGAVAWFAVGVATYFGHQAELPSLIMMEAMVIGMNVRGIHLWIKRGAS